MKVAINMKEKNQDATLRARLAYVLEFINAHPLATPHLQLVLQHSDNPKPDLIIDYSSHDHGFTQGTRIPAQCAFFTNKVYTSTYLNRVVTNRDRHLMIVETESRNSRSAFLGQSLDFDIFESIFFHISRYEEYFASSEDKCAEGWLEESKHLLVSQGVEQEPHTDHLVHFLVQWITKQEHTRSATTFSITHDIDILQKFPSWLRMVRSAVGHVYYRRPVRLAAATFTHWTQMQKGKSRDPYNTFEVLLRKSSLWKEKTIFLMAGGHSRWDGYYRISDPQIKEVLRLAQDRGYQIGFHPSYAAATDRDRFYQDKEAIQSTLDLVITHSRQHFLRFDWDITPKIITDQKIQVDYSMGFNRHLGFRCGTGFPYHMFDFTSEQAYPWLEHPMAFMESALVNFCTDQQKDIYTTGVEFFDKNKFDTHLSINMHNSNFDPLIDHGPQILGLYTDAIIPQVEEN